MGTRTVATKRKQTKKKPSAPTTKKKPTLKERMLAEEVETKVTQPVEETETRFFSNASFNVDADGNPIVDEEKRAEILAATKEARRKVPKWIRFKKFLKEYWLKIIALATVLIGAPLGIIWSRGIESRWVDGQYVLVAPPDEVHLHVAIGIWIVFILAGLFVWRIDDLLKAQKSDIDKTPKCKKTAIKIAVWGLVAGPLIGYRKGASRPFGSVHSVPVPTSMEWRFVWSVCFFFIALGIILWFLTRRVQKLVALQKIKGKVSSESRSKVHNT